LIFAYILSIHVYMCTYQRGTICFVFLSLLCYDICICTHPRIMNSCFIPRSNFYYALGCVCISNCIGPYLPPPHFRWNSDMISSSKMLRCCCSSYCFVIIAYELELFNWQKGKIDFTSLSERYSNHKSLTDLVTTTIIWSIYGCTIFCLLKIIWVSNVY